MSLTCLAPFPQTSGVLSSGSSCWSDPHFLCSFSRLCTLACIHLCADAHVSLLTLCEVPFLPGGCLPWLVTSVCLGLCSFSWLMAHRCAHWTLSSFLCGLAPRPFQNAGIIMSPELHCVWGVNHLSMFVAVLSNPSACFLSSGVHIKHCCTSTVSWTLPGHWQTLWARVLSFKQHITVFLICIFAFC